MINFDALAGAIDMLFSSATPWLVVVPGILIGLVFGAIPGLQISMAMAVFLPIKAPIVGTKIRAISKEAMSVISTVMGRYFINSPTTPGQNTSGKKAASVVAVEAMIGVAIRDDACR